MEDICFDKTYKKNRLIYKTHWIEYYEFFVLSILLILMFFSLYLITILNYNLFSIILIVFLIFFFIGFAIIKNKKGRQFIELETGLLKESNKIFIVNYIDKKVYNLKFDNENYMRYNSNLKITLLRQELTVIFDDNKILINLVNCSGLIRFPSFIKQQQLINDLKKKINRVGKGESHP